MPTIVMSSGYPQQTIERLSEQYDLIVIDRQVEALAHIRQMPEPPDAVCIGYVRGGEGINDLAAEDMLRELLKLDPTMPVVISTGERLVSAIVELIKHGAFDYVIEPMHRGKLELIADYTQHLSIALNQAVQWRAVTRENERLKQDLTREQLPVSIQTRSERMLAALSLAKKVAATPATVLITGESGVGKELIARTIHDMSDRKDLPFTAINCGSLGESLLTSELFGHVRGSFTGADSDRLGVIREAAGGTLFLDEIGTVPPTFQVMLLRVLEQRVARPVGGSDEYPVRCRFIAAANQDLHAMTRTGGFRQDFYYRLNTFHLHIPPLRERRRDIAVLADYFLKHLAHQYGREVTGIEPAAMNLLEACDWPGNVRQLRNAIERALIVCEGSRITPADLDAEVRGKAGSTPAGDQAYQDAMQTFERSLLDSAITRADGNLSKAARLLDMKRTTLAYRVNQLGLRKSRR